MRIRSWTACLAAVALTVGPGVANASAETISFDTPVFGPVTNECTGDTFIVDGMAHNKVTTNSSLTGSKSQIEMNLTGVKATTVTGVRYVMNQQSSDMQHADFDPFGNAQITIEETTNLTRQGEDGALVTGDDWRLHAVAHFTIVNGVVSERRGDVRQDGPPRRLPLTGGPPNTRRGRPSTGRPPSKRLEETRPWASPRCSAFPSRRPRTV
jgi:hypothetical protein